MRRLQLTAFGNFCLLCFSLHRHQPVHVRLFLCFGMGNLDVLQDFTRSHFTYWANSVSLRQHVRKVGMCSLHATPCSFLGFHIYGSTSKFAEIADFRFIARALLIPEDIGALWATPFASGILRGWHGWALHWNFSLWNQHIFKWTCSFSYKIRCDHHTITVNVSRWPLDAWCWTTLGWDCFITMLGQSMLVIACIYFNMGCFTTSKTNNTIQKTLTVKIN